LDVTEAAVLKDVANHNPDHLLGDCHYRWAFANLEALCRRRAFAPVVRAGWAPTGRRLDTTYLSKSKNVQYVRECRCAKEVPELVGTAVAKH